MIADLKPYAEYKESGLPWLGQVPGHWATRRLCHACDMRVSNVDKHTKLGETPVRLCNYVEVYKNERIRESTRFMVATASDDERVRFGLRKGDVLITKDSEQWNDIGVPALVEVEAPDLVCGYHLAILRARPGLSGGFLHRAIESHFIAAQFHVEANGVTRYGLSHGAIQGVAIPLPPPAEQAAIVRFLDWANARLERAIRAKRKVIALLGEQKQAIIHRAVTRGLDPSVPLKPSGIPWLGDIPGHWQVRKVRTVADLIVSNVDKHSKPNETGVRLCNYVDVYKNDTINERLAFMRATATRDEIERFRIRVGDVIITKDSEEWDDIGVPSRVTYEADDLVCGYHLGILRPRPELITGAFLHLVLEDRFVATQMHVRAKGVTRYGLGHSAIKHVMLPLPPVREQEPICSQLKADLAAFVVATRRLHREIELLREYRHRLVADVVTGKLDVREAAARLPDEAPLNIAEDDAELSGEIEAADEEAAV